MIERSKETFSQNGGIHFIFVILFCPSSELMMVLLLCMWSVWTSRCFSCDIREPQTQSCRLNSVGLQGGVGHSLVRWERGELGLPPAVRHELTAHPDCPVPSGSMLRTTLAWGVRITVKECRSGVLYPFLFLMLSPFFCTNPAGRTSFNAGSVIEVPLFCDSCTA